MLSRSYYTVLSSEYYNKNVIRLFKNLLEDFLNDYDRNFGKFTVPISHIKSSIHEYLYEIVSQLFGFKLIEASSKFYLFEASTVYFNINWQIVSGSYEFSVIHGFKYEIDVEKNCAYVYCDGEDDDEKDTIVGTDDD